MSRETLPGQKQFCASVLFVTRSLPMKTLLVHHKKYDLWIQPGGHIEYDENPVQTAVREALEETGIDVSSLLLPGEKIDEYAFPLPVPDFFLEEKIPAYQDTPEHFHIDFLYVVRLPEVVEPRLEAGGAHDIQWFTLEEVRKLPTFANTLYILEKLMRSQTT